MILYLLTYFDFEATLCYRMNAQFLIDNSLNISYENLNYSQANQVKDYHHSNLSFSQILMILIKIFLNLNYC